MTDFSILAGNLEERGFSVRVFSNQKEAETYLNGMIDNCTVGFGGSGTLESMGLFESLGQHNRVYWHWKQGNGVKADAAAAQVYLTSVNAIAETGEIINIDGTGNRISASLYGHNMVYFVAGRNKITKTMEQALWRARNVAAPKRARQMGVKTPCALKGDRCYDCKGPERICRGLTVLWAAMKGQPAEVILIDQELGN